MQSFLKQWAIVPIVLSIIFLMTLRGQQFIRVGQKSCTVRSFGESRVQVSIEAS